MSEEGEIHASHVPMVLELSTANPPFVPGTDLIGHLAKANPQWRTLGASKEVLAIFQGPDAYVSPTWYDHPNVPTWNYASVHAYGVPRVVDDEAELLDLVTRQVERYERPGKSSYRVEDLPPDLLRKELRGIVGFRLSISRVAAAYKLSQNRHEVDHANVVSRLEARGDAGSRQVAELMKRAGSRGARGRQRP